jgi:hypothetical protein
MARLTLPTRSCAPALDNHTSREKLAAAIIPPARLARDMVARSIPLPTPVMNANLPTIDIAFSSAASSSKLKLKIHPGYFP